MLSVAVFETGEQPARRVVDLIAECFAEEQIAVSMAETKPGACARRDGVARIGERGRRK
jgi:hypothetical protein